MPDETLIELPDFALDWRDTPRGFMRADFVDTLQCIGTFGTPEEAGAAYREAKRELYGEFAR